MTLSKRSGISERLLLDVVPQPKPAPDLKEDNATALLALAKLFRHDPVTGNLVLENGKSRIILMKDGTIRIEGRRIISAADEGIVMHAAYIELN